MITDPCVIWQDGSRRLEYVCTLIVRHPTAYPDSGIQTIWSISGDPVYYYWGNHIISAIPSLTEWIEDEAKGQGCVELSEELRKRVLAGDYAPRLKELADWMGNGWLKQRLANERALQQDYELSVQQSEIIEALRCGMTVDVIAQNLGIGVRNVNSAIYVANKNLKKPPRCHKIH
jgi:hypothetical protein